MIIPSSKTIDSKMKRMLLIILMSALIPVTSALSQQKGNLRYTIMVTKFENLSQFPEGQFSLTQTFGAILTDSLQKTGKFIVLGEKDMRAEAIEEQDFGASGRVAGGKKKPDIGHMTPAQLLVKGEITHFQHSTTGGTGGVSFKGFKFGGQKDHAEINAVIYVVDSTTGQVVASKKVVGEASRSGVDIGFTYTDWSTDLSGFKNTNIGKAAEQAIDQAVEFIIKQLETIPWEGTVIMVRGDKLYINRGSREGVTPGQRFIVGSAERVRDPDTGEVLYVLVNKVGTVVIEQVREKLSIGRPTEGGENIQNGMTVMLY